MRASTLNCSALTCADDEDLDASLCYTRCRSGYKGVGPVCWEKSCRGGYQDFGAMSAGLLSDFQITIPELGRVEATSMPIVLLTSNNTRELTEALKRRCLYLWIDYPDLEHELEIVRLHAPDLDEHVARRLVEVVGQVRELDLKKPPSIAEAIDWARALLLLGAQDIDSKTFADTMSIIVKHRTDLDVVTERVGVKLGLPQDSLGAASAG